jgi:hypothetical protein
MSKFTCTERNIIKNLVATLTIKRIPDNEIVKEIFAQTNKTMTVRHLARIKKRLKIDSFNWYTKLRQDQYAYIAEYKERIDELLSLQKKHHEIIKSNEHNPQIQQTSLAELHKMSITLSNFYDVASDLVTYHASVSALSKDKSSQESERSPSNITV